MVFNAKGQWRRRRRRQAVRIAKCVPSTHPKKVNKKKRLPRKFHGRNGHNTDQDGVEPGRERESEGRVSSLSFEGDAFNEFSIVVFVDAFEEFAAENVYQKQKWGRPWGICFSLLSALNPTPLPGHGMKAGLNYKKSKTNTMRVSSVVGSLDGEMR